MSVNITYLSEGKGEIYKGTVLDDSACPNAAFLSPIIACE